MTRRTKRRALAVCAGVALCTGPIVPGMSAAHAHADPTRPPAIAEAWQQSSSVGLQGDGSLSDVTGLSASNIWAVGQQDIWDVWENRGAISHWDGRSWTQIGIRNDDTGAGHLRSIAAASATDLWAVGTAHDSLPYVAHGDGSAFDRVGVDQLRAGDWLGGVAAVPGKVVAVGSRDRAPLVVTRTGAAWQVEPVRVTEGTLYGVSVSAKGDTGWAVGDSEGEPLVVRLSEGSWKRVSLPEIPGGYLRDVHLDGAKRALAIGGVYHGSRKVSPLLLSWNGKRWSRVRVPDGEASLYGVTGDGKGRFWVSGFDPQRPGEPYLLRYDGKHTKIIRGEAARGGESSTMRLQAVTYVPGTSTVWAVGHVVDAEDKYTDVVERFGPKGTRSTSS
ncbi:hypothetical protein HNP84_009477 [Thermocatellispora tengchongensis]|uniref:Uncharacterized protein n=1 Tax=Thermocatellispora tengchongensis TaxID=1073253 RepID=A0A840PNT7_9ACTN|nr:hypothetical protein [Thermocatellispora tengchongensis]MBB5139713.1 hypothetical protein [Thermocatellispora tengchongensis]